MSDWGDEHKFKIFVGESSWKSWVELDGKRLEGVVGVSFDLSAQGDTFINLKIKGEVEVEGQFVERNILIAQIPQCEWCHKIGEPTIQLAD